MTETTVHLKYGYCKGCCHWVPRDEMLVLNIDAYSAESEKTVIRHRYCPPCHKRVIEELQIGAWDHVLKNEVELRADPNLARAAGLEYDPSLVEEAAEVRRMEDAERAEIRARREDEKMRKRGAATDDSEGALRRRGMDVPEPVEG